MTLVREKQVVENKNFFSLVEDGFAYFGGACLVMIAAMVVVSVAGRYFGIYVSEVEEISTYLMVIIAYLPAAGCLRRGEFVSVKIILILLPSASREKLMAVTNVLSTFVLLVIVVTTYLLFSESFNAKLVSTSILRVPLYLPQLPMIIGASLLLIRMLVITWNSMRSLIKKNKGYKMQQEES